jgi:DNA-binding MarR family transcriptional regulator
MERQELIAEIIKLQRKVDRAWRQYELNVWMDLPLTMAQLKSLFFISNQGSTHSGKLAAALGVTPTNVTGIIDRLVKQGLVSRTEDKQDRRVVLLQATGKGEELVARLRERRRSYLAEVLARLSVDDLTVLARGLNSLAKAAEKYEGETRNEHD